jgi:hypothetical protein
VRRDNLKRTIIFSILFILLAFNAYATVADSPSVNISACNGSVTAFSFTFGAGSTSEVKVTQTSSTGTVTTLSETTDYTVACANSNCESGGTVNTVNTCPSGSTITVERNVAFTQAADFTEGMPTLYETFEDGLDKLTRITQQLRRSQSALETEVESAPTAATLYYYDLSNYANITAAIADIGGLKATLICRAPVTLEADTAIPSNIEFIGAKGCVITSGAFTLTGLRESYPEWFATNTTPGTTDMTSAIQSAVNSITAGGTVYFDPSKLYLITDEITISSLYPINLKSEMNHIAASTATTIPGIIIGANITGSMFKYTAPDSGARSKQGGGKISGLVFYDATATGTDYGTYTVTSILDLNDFNYSSVEDCEFRGINGAAIVGEYNIMTSIKSNKVYYCKSGMSFPSTDASYIAQSMLIFDNRFEVNHGTYLSIGANARKVKIIANGFEADDGTATSEQEFVTLAGKGCTLSENHFNHDLVNAVTVSGNDNSITGNFWGTGDADTTSLVVSGLGNSITGNNFETTRTSIDVSVTGTYNAITGNVFYVSGQVALSGDNNTFTGNTLFKMYPTTANLGAGDDFWVNASGLYSIVSNNTLSNQGGAVTTVGGIKISGEYSIANGNNFRAFFGTDNGAIGIYNTVANSTITGNSKGSTTTLISTTDYNAEISNNYDTTPILTGTATFNPADLADGVGETTTVTVTGAALGDLVEVSFDKDLGGLTLTGYVSSANTVSARFQNETTGNVNLAQGTLKAKVRKR